MQRSRRKNEGFNKASNTAQVFLIMNWAVGELTRIIGYTGNNLKFNPSRDNKQRKREDEQNAPTRKNVKRRARR
jgi:hypothetical protein